MSDFFGTLYGNDALKAYLTDKISASSLPHALIFEGPDGSGKYTAALALSAGLNPMYKDKILRNISPDVVTLKPENDKTSIGVSAVREIKRNAFIRPQELTNRVFIIRKAHLLTAEAQNALLKILEEPPPGVYFFLLAENSSLLLSTVVSRAPVLKMSVFSDSEIAGIIVGLSENAARLRDHSPESFAAAVKCSGGSIGKALELIEEPDSVSAKIKADVLSFLDILSEGKNDGILFFFIRSAYKRDQFLIFASELSASVRDMLKAKYGETLKPLFFTDVETAEEYSARFAKNILLNVHFAVEKITETLTYNVSTDTFSIAAADLFYRAVRRSVRKN